MPSVIVECYSTDSHRDIPLFSQKIWFDSVDELTSDYVRVYRAVRDYSKVDYIEVELRCNFCHYYNSRGQIVQRYLGCKDVELRNISLPDNDPYTYTVYSVDCAICRKIPTESEDESDSSF